MKLDIHDLFDSFSDETVDIKINTTISSDRVLARTKRKIKEDSMNTTQKTKVISIPMIAAAAAIMISATAFAAYHLLTPQEIATYVDNYKLAEVFSAEDTKFNFEPQISGDYTFELLGITSGKNLSQFTDTEEDKSYIVGAISRTDGGKLLDYPEMMLTPLISGYQPWEVNIFTLNGAKNEFIYDDVDYFIYECSNLEIFSDHTVYIAMYEGMAPGAETFTMENDGSIHFNESFDAPHAIFTLPLDPSTADPEAVRTLLENPE